MLTIKELFHKIGNQHNKISVGAGLTKELIEQKTKESAISEEIKELLFERLTDLEQKAIETDKVLNQLRDIVYNILDPVTGRPKAPLNTKGGR